MLTKSIRWRFMLWLAFLLFVVLSGFGITAYQLHLNNRFEQLDAELKTRVNALSAALRTPPSVPGRMGPPLEWEERGEPRVPPERRGGFKPLPPEFGLPREPRPVPGDPRPLPPHELPPFGPPLTNVAASGRITTLFASKATNDFYFALWSRDNSLRSTNAPVELPRPTRLGNNTDTDFRTRGSFREAFHYTERGDCVLAGRTVALEFASTRRFTGWLIAGGLAVLLLGMGGAGLLARRVLQPVAQISTTAARISAGNLQERINVSATENELGQLATTLNATFARLEAAFAQQMQFTADASHELRTPLAVMISEAQTTLNKPRSEAEYRETIQIFLATAQQMRRLTESLLELARFDAGQAMLQRDSLDLAEVARGAVELVRPLAAARGLSLSTDLPPTHTRGDPQRLRQVVVNLLTNAIHYNSKDGAVQILTKVESGTAWLSVTDSGPGIAPEEVPHLFERFYRADPSRTQSDGRTGLGLAICKAIMDAHDGCIDVKTELGKGSTFSLRLPQA